MRGKTSNTSPPPGGLALVAAGCSGGEPSTGTGVPAETTTTAAAGPATGGTDVDDTTDGAPQTAEVPGGGQGEDGKCAEVSNRRNERQTALARDLMAAAEAAPGPASPAQIEEIAAAAEAEQGRKGRGPDEPPPEPARSDSRGPCQTDEAPWACEEPPGEEP